MQTGKGLSAAPPFSLQDVKNAIPAQCLKKDTWRSMSYLIKDVAIVFGLAAGAQALNQWYDLTHCSMSIGKMNAVCCAVAIAQRARLICLASLAANIF